MKFTYNWLKEFVSFKEPPQRIAEILTMAGLEVESLSPLSSEERGVDDWLMEIAVTPNRGDCLGIVGLAREVAALTGGRLRFPPVSPHTNDSSIRQRIKIKVLSPRLCPRYSARVVQGVQVAPSPSWMRLRLEACGIRSINSAVDITNYVMLETGQPLHAFDLDRLTSKQVVVRQAGEIRKFVTLDGVERELAREDLLICDNDIPVALAGVMGGRDSEVRSDTRSVLLESANFDPLSVRRTAKRLGLHSEASHRFERGVDPEGTLHALNRAAFLLAEVAGGVPLKGIADCYCYRTRAAPILLREERVKALLGIELKPKQIEKILRCLGLRIRAQTKNGFRIVPPSYRRDLSREADLIEELARIHGYEKIPSTLPLVKQQGGRIDLRLRRERRVRSFLVGEGLTEMINLPFTSRDMNARFFGLWEDGGSPVEVLNPLIQDNAEMRLSLVPGLLENLQSHTAHKIRSFWGFALGKVFRLNSMRSSDEKQHLAGLLYGVRERRGLQIKEEARCTFLDAKGLVEGILEVMALEHLAAWTTCDIPSFLHPGKAASLQFDGAGVGYFGEIHPDLCEELHLAPSLLFELDFERLVRYPPRELTARSLPRFPSVERDLAVVVDEGLPAQQIISWIKEQFGHSLVEDVVVFDQYRGSSIPEGKKSLAYRISYRAEDKTLTDEEVNAVHRDMVARIGEVFGGQLRS
jgi:phenylalanyl-tRNA synthetase beta chain